MYNRSVEITEYVGNGVICDPYWYMCGTYPVEDVVGSRGGWDFGFNIGGGVGFGIGEIVGVLRRDAVSTTCGAGVRRPTLPAGAEAARRQRQRHLLSAHVRIPFLKEDVMKALLQPQRSSCWRRRSRWRRKPASTSTRRRTSRSSRPTPSRTARRSGIRWSTTGSSPPSKPSSPPRGCRTNNATPDVVVVYHVAFDKKQDITAYSSGYGGYGRTAIGREAAGERPRPTCASTRFSSAHWSSTSPTRPRRRSCGAAWASRKWTPRRRPRSETRTSAAAVKKILKDFPPKKKA